MMRKILALFVLFYNPNDDYQEQLYECLKEKDALVDKQNRVRSIQVPGACIIVCYDDFPDDLMMKTIREQADRVQPKARALILHKNTSVEIRAEQVRLAAKDNVLADTDIYEYSYTLSDPVYKALVDILKLGFPGARLWIGNVGRIIADFFKNLF